MRHAVSPCFRFQVTSSGFPHPASQLPQQQHCQHDKRQHARRRFDNGKKWSGGGNLQCFGAGRNHGNQAKLFQIIRYRRNNGQRQQPFFNMPESALPPTAGWSDEDRYSRTARDKPCRRPPGGADKTACPLHPSYPNRFADKRCLNCTAAYRAKSGRLKNGSVRVVCK